MELNKMEFWKGDQWLRSLHITDMTSKDKFKKQATYPRGDSTYLKLEYWKKYDKQDQQGKAAFNHRNPMPKCKNLKYDKHNNNVVLKYL
jgi:hypothetical protein